MRAMTVLAGALLLAAGCHTLPAVAQDATVDGKPCNALCRSWLGLPPQAEAALDSERPAEPPAPPPPRVPRDTARATAETNPTTAVEAAPPPAAATTRIGRSRKLAAPTVADLDGAAAVSRVMLPEKPAPTRVAPAERIASEGSDASTPIVGNPRWKDYADTVFRYRGSILTPEYDRAHPTAPPLSASLKVSR